MALPHPLDNEWRIFDGYVKAFYDVEHPETKEVQEHCWPNAGQIHAFGKDFKSGECKVRISLLHPYGKKPQLDESTVAHLHRLYE
jgi:hypothetical protein